MQRDADQQTPSFALFIPERSETAEDAYAKALAQALDAGVIGIPGSVPKPNEIAYKAAREAWESLPVASQPLIAGASLAAFAPLAPLFPSRNCAVLLHHPIAQATANSAERAWLSAIEHETLSLAPHLVVSSDAVAEAIGGKDARISVVEPPAAPLERAHGSSDGTVRLLTGGAFVSSRAHEVLFAALARLMDLDWRLAIIVGAEDEVLGERAAEAISRLGLEERVSLTEAKDKTRCETLWLGADIYALTEASLGYQALIAAAFKRGLPVAVCQIKDDAPTIPPAAGATALPGDHAQLGKALRRMIFDRRLRTEMAEAAFRAGQALPDRAKVRSRLTATLG